MKSYKLVSLSLAVAMLGFVSCDESTSEIGGDQSEFGEIGVKITSTNVPDVLQGATAVITDLEDGVSVLSLTADFTEEEIAEIQDRFPSFDGQESFDAEFRVTDKGVQSVYDDGTSFTLVKYDAKVGDKYKVTRNGQNLVREVTEKITEDEYYWNGWLLKTITVTETGRAVPGLASTELTFNHTFGLVGYTWNFEDGSSEAFPIILQ